MDYKLVIFNTAALGFPSAILLQTNILLTERTQWKENINLIVLYSLTLIKMFTQFR